MQMFVKLADVLLFDREELDYKTFAIRKHKLQLYGELPYSFHLAQVEQTLATCNFTEYRYRASAWLHDVVEDTDATIAQIGTYFGEEVAGIVWACTGEGSNRAEKQEAIRWRISQYPDAAPVKVADRYCNIASSWATKNDKKLKMYIDEWPSFKEAVKQHMMVSSRHAVFFNYLEDLIENVRK